MKRKLIVTAIFSALLISASFDSSGQWADKLKTTVGTGTTALTSLLDTIITFIMAISGFLFIVGIVQTAVKYFTGDREAFRSLSGMFYGIMIIFIGSSLVKVLFF